MFYPIWEDLSLNLSIVHQQKATVWGFLFDLRELVLCASPWSCVHHSCIVGSHPSTWNQILQDSILQFKFTLGKQWMLCRSQSITLNHKSMFESNQISVTSIFCRKHLRAGTDPYCQPVLFLDFWTRSLLSFTENLQTCRCVSFSEQLSAWRQLRVDKVK